MYLSQKNTPAVFEQLNRCLDDVKEWMSTNKLKLNPEKTEFMLFGSKKQKERLKVLFSIDILGGPLCPAESVMNSYGSILIYPCLSMFRVSAKAVLSNSVSSDISGSFLIMMHLYVWPMPLSVGLL